MLVLSRKTGQKLIINDNIEVIVIETRGEFVRLGIKAPRNVTIYREEIYEEIKKANQQAIVQNTADNVESAMNLMKDKNIVTDTEAANKFNASLKKLKKDN
ncbi:MAG: carbon storage regulator CsrA [bacterium]